MIAPSPTLALERGPPPTLDPQRCAADRRPRCDLARSVADDRQIGVDDSRGRIVLGRRDAESMEVTSSRRVVGVIVAHQRAAVTQSVRTRDLAAPPESSDRDRRAPIRGRRPMRYDS